MTDMITSHKYAVVDLEATSPGRNASIIQVGIVLVEDGKISSTYTTDVNPHEPLDESIKHLTGLTDQRLAEAPTFSQVAAEIYDLIKDAVFVAHNVRFDANLLAEQLFMEGFELRTPRVDTVELAQVFFPTLEKYNLSTLSQALGLELEEAHTALSDAYATAQLLLALQAKIASLPRQLLEQLLVFSDNLLYESHLVILEQLDKAPLKPQGAYLEAGGLLVKQISVYGKERAMSADFQTNLALLGLTARLPQLAFAEQLEQAFNQHQVSFLQAQTGLGKTYAYLLTLLAQANDRSVIVAVPTLVLQDHLMANEVQRLSQVFRINAISLKSPSHYIDLERFASQLAVCDNNRLINRCKMRLLVWLFETETGDLDELRQKQGQEAYFDSMRHDGRLVEHGLFSDLDFLKRRQEQLLRSRLIVTNHAYLLTRGSDDKAFLADKMIVIDEGQRFFLAAEQCSRAKVDVTRQLEVVRAYQERRFSTLYRRLLERLNFECQRLLAMAKTSGVTLLTSEQLATIKQDLSECDLSDLADFKAVLSEPYSTFWLVTQIREGERRTELHAARLDLMQVKPFFPESSQLFYISATLNISPEVSLAALLGYSEVGSFCLPSSPVTNQAIWIDQSMPMLTEVSQDIWLQEVVGRLLTLSQLERPILVLFTARQTMLQVSACLDDLAIKHLCQDKHGIASHLKNRFDKHNQAILLGTGAFWEGVDFARHSQLITIIVRLPFDCPEDYLVQKIDDRLRQEGKNPFTAYSLPLVTLRLKQAFGRTNRSSKQRSAVLILDSRLIYKPYGSTITQALTNQYRLEVQSFDACQSQISQFLDQELLSGDA